MIIEAKFTGGNSLGYSHGKKYILKMANIRGISVKRTDGTGYCPYQSLSAFFRNWTDVKVLN